MKRIQLAEQPLDLGQLLDMAQDSPVVVVAADGTTFMVSLADDFDQEVEQLRHSQEFQSFLESRTSKARPRRSLAAVAQAIDAELASMSDTE